MKKYLLAFLFLPMLAASTFAQYDQGDWQHDYVDPTGRNEMSGVKVWFKLETCNQQGVVLLKFENSNAYQVELSWENAVFKKNLKWSAYKPERSQFTVAANQTVEGDCNSDNALAVPLSDFSVKPEEFERLTTQELIVNPIR